MRSQGFLNLHGLVTPDLVEGSSYEEHTALDDLAMTCETKVVGCGKSLGDSLLDFP